jgi:hypothetical protein
LKNLRDILSGCRLYRAGWEELPLVEGVICGMAVLIVGRRRKVDERWQTLIELITLCSVSKLTKM